MGQLSSLLIIVVLLNRYTEFRLIIQNIYFLEREGLFMSRASLPASFKEMLQKEGYSEVIIKKLWKWYDFSEKKGVASF